MINYTSSKFSKTLFKLYDAIVQDDPAYNIEYWHYGIGDIISFGSQTMILSDPGFNINVILKDLGNSTLKVTRLIYPE